MAAKLAGKVAVVTGASKGIGAGIAKHLAAAGAAVVVNYASSREGAEKVVGEIEQAGGRAVAVGADVSKPERIKALSDAAVERFGRVDILVNNAGIYEFAPLDAVTPEHFHKHFDLNVLGPILATQEAARRFGPGGGSVINISSLAAIHPLANVSVYSATKAAVDAVSTALAKELGAKQIRVNSLNPGYVETEGTHAAGIAGSDREQQMVARTPLGRTGQPDDIGKVAVFLASDDAGWITGQAIQAAGGWPS